MWYGRRIPRPFKNFSKCPQQSVQFQSVVLSPRETGFTRETAANDHAQNGRQLVRRPRKKKLQKPLWVYKQSKRCRKRRRQRARRGRERPQGAAVVAFGDADLHSLKGNPSVPVKKFRQVLAQKALMLCVDEYKTSKVCSSCDTTTIEVRDNNQLFCKHK
ncbi:uncharacterized protein BYT42DRAFT_52392 [Radiomyces spectabilis]|uniref:uncharacterized protein n=1 Tax=Radiomyces spectabilis TaxID=64574 RepID=UPI0022200F0D|nr:uncharacterized protein BYT42DRAFT_52392 [Radiomyces spectabilis]KAI8372930.1 hypothetical protein BYT42DRAFT_52392 [Radiomyces spectabilis]